MTRIRNVFFILLSVAGYALSLPQTNWWFLSFGCLTPFLYVLDRSDTVPKAMVHGLLWGMTLGAAIGYWVFFTLLHHYEAPLAQSLAFFFLCLLVPVAGIYMVFAFAYWFFRQNTPVFYGLILPSVWVLLEYLKGCFSFLVPWGGLDGALSGFPRFVQIADICGSYGLVWIAVAVNGLVFFCLKNSFGHTRDYRQKDRLRSGIGLFLIGLLIAVPLLYGGYRLQQIQARVQARQDEPGSRIRATLVQGNFSTKERWSGMGFYQRVLRYLEMSTDQGLKDKIASGQRVIVWPENTLNVSSKLNDALFIGIMGEIGENALLIAGGLNADAERGHVYNSAYFVSGTGRLMRYDKHILLPYAETSPFIDLLDAYYTAPSEFSAGKTPLCMNLPPGPAGPSVCFEVLYPGFVRKAVKDGARYLVNLSNDSWFGDTPMPWLHLNAARLRAIENRRFLLRTSTSGISALIGPDGNPLIQSHLFEQERLDGEFVLLDQVSVYTRWGDWVIIFALLVLLCDLVIRVWGKENPPNLKK